MNTNSLEGEQETYRLILNSNYFTIPTDFQSINDVNQDIYTALLTKHEYIVESKVRDDIFKCFIDWWIKKESIDLSIDNITEYILLSQEFDLMKDQIQMFNKFHIKEKQKINEMLKDRISEKLNSLEKKKKLQSQIIHLLFNNTRIETYSNFLNVKRDLYKACSNYKINDVYFIISQKVEHNGLIYSINFHDKTAFLLGPSEFNYSIIVPRSINYNSEEYVITAVKKSPYKWDKVNANYLRFSEDSELKLIDKSAFKNATIYKILIPSTVTQIGDKAFHLSGIEKIRFSEGSKLEIIGKNAFSFTKLNKIQIPSEVVRIEEYAFSGNLLLKSIKFSNYSKLEYIGPYTFSNTTIKKIEIPSHVKQICEFAFEGCQKLKTVEFENDYSELHSIGNYIFYTTSNLSSLSFPSCIEQIGENWYFGITKLNNIKIAKGKTQNISIYDDKLIIKKSDLTKDEFDVLLFARSDIEKVTIPSFIKKIQRGAFYHCSKLKEIDFQEDSQLRIIEEHAFCYNTSLTKITIPSSVVEFQKKWFFENPNLVDIQILNCKEKNIKNYYNKFILGKTNTKKNEFDVLLLAKRDIKDEISIPSFIKRIESCAFQNCEQLKIVKFDDDSKLQIIGENSFNKSSINTITIPSNVYSIKNAAFSECKKLKNVIFKNDTELNYIGENAFSHSGITLISIPSKITTIEKESFLCCYDLKYITFAHDSILAKIGENAFYGSQIETILIPSSVIWISERALDTGSLKVVEFQKNSKLQIIGKNSFNTPSIEQILIPEHVTTIEKEAFYMCKNLERIDFADKSELKYIGPNAFDSTAIKNIKIPPNVVQIDKKSFLNCTNLHSVHFSVNSKIVSKNISQNDNIINRSQVVKICNDAFENCNNLKIIEFVGNSEIQSNAFVDCSVEKIIIPSNVELDEKWCNKTPKLNYFIIKPNGKQNVMNYKNEFILGKSNPKSDIFNTIIFARRDIKEAIIPSFIKQIGSFAFQMCTNLRKIEFEQNSKLKVIGRHAFEESSIDCICIPSTVEKIYHRAFSLCKKMRYVCFLENSQLKLIDKYVFNESSIKSISIPPNIITMAENAFKDTLTIIIEIDTNSKLKSFDLNAFSYSYNLKIIMIPNRLENLLKINPKYFDEDSDFSD